MSARGPSVPAISAGLLASFVGFASSFAVVVKGLAAVGASPAEVASGLLALSVAMGVSAIVLSLRTRMPISTAWSTPGAALLAGAGVPEGGFPVAVGAFLVTGLLIMIAGLWKPLGRAVAAIPGSLASAMLAGVLLPLCLAPVKAVAVSPALALAIIATWAIVGRINRLYAVPAAVLMAVVLILATTTLPPIGWEAFLPRPVLIEPSFSAAALIGIALPLFIVTMASQNIPGVAVLKVNGYEAAPGPLFRDTGIVSILSAPFGGHAVNLAAITAALCAGPDADPDRERRYWAAVIAGFGYIVIGLCAGAATAFIAAAPPLLIEAVAGLALVGALASSLAAATAEPADREAAAVTFLVTASGLSFLGVGAAFWGLLAGGAMLALARWRRA